MPQIRVVVSPQGEVTVTTQGFKGSGCKAASQALEKALGTAQDERPTSEFYEQPTLQHEQGLGES